MRREEEEEQKKKKKKKKIYLSCTQLLAELVSTLATYVQLGLCSLTEINELQPLFGPHAASPSGRVSVNLVLRLSLLLVEKGFNSNICMRAH